MSVDMQADAEILGAIASPIDPKTPLPQPPAKEIEGLKAALGILLDEGTELRARVAAIENRAAGFYTADDARLLSLAIDARISAIEAKLSDDGR